MIKNMVSFNNDSSVEFEIRPRIIGGMFGLEEISKPNGSSPSFLKGQDVFLVNGRSGISLLVDHLSPPQVWMPSYLCGSMVKAVDQELTTLNFYEVDYDLSVPSLEWLDNVQPNDLVVLIDYFGFPCDKTCATQAKGRGAWVLEDASQALLSETTDYFSDFILFSPRKFLGIPDGGIIRVNCDVDFNDVDLQSPPANWWLKSFHATVLRREFDLYGGNRRWFELFQETNAEGPIGNYTISELSKMMLMHSFDYSKIAQKRIDNYQVLSEKLNGLALFPNLPLGVVPLGFPVRMKNRDRLRRALFNHQIYPPVHWPLQGVVPEEFRDSHKLVNEIMTLPCDQRYGNKDMEWMAEVIRGALAC